MVNRIYTLILIILFPILFTNQVASQVVDFDDPDRIVYWFDVNVRTVNDKETGFEEYTVIRMGKKVTNGTIDEFEEWLWKGMGLGSKIAIGPFSVYDDAYEAMLMFDLRDTTEVENTTDKYWFLVKVDISERSKSYEFDRMAAAVAMGTKSEFKDILIESLNFKILAIGPFTDQIDAEEAKRLYRLEE